MNESDNGFDGIGGQPWENFRYQWPVQYFQGRGVTLKVEAFIKIG